MDQAEIVMGIERRARALGVPIHALCGRAGIHPSTFSRWKKTAKNPNPTGASLLSIGALYAALDEIAAERRGSRPNRKVVHA